VFEESVEEHLVNPTFVYDYPAELCPLTRRKDGDERVAERFEPFIARMEMGNAYTELNDPALQKANFENQLKEADHDWGILDQDFIRALEHGMPPAGGLGIGIDRLVMVLTNNHSIRDVILFPLLRQV
jgi:lysyl-tRNA synthetase class 2